jgi:hypothetical protein
MSAALFYWRWYPVITTKRLLLENCDTPGCFLIAAGCKVAQGYYFGKPAAAASELLPRNLNVRSVASLCRLAHRTSRKCDPSVDIWVVVTSGLYEYPSWIRETV